MGGTWLRLLGRGGLLVRLSGQGPAAEAAGAPQRPAEQGDGDHDDQGPEQLVVGQDQNDVLRIVIAVVAVAIIAGAVILSKRREVAIADDGDNTGSSSFTHHA